MNVIIVMMSINRQQSPFDALCVAVRASSRIESHDSSQRHNVTTTTTTTKRHDNNNNYNDDSTRREAT